MTEFLLVTFVILNTVLLINGEPRIVGGAPAMSAQFPYQVSIQHTPVGPHFCGGSVINSRHVVTAAHCMDGKNPDDILIWAGGIYLRDKGGVKRFVQSITIHNHWNSKTLDSDVAVLKLKDPFEFSKYIQPISLPRSETKTGAVCSISGWGTKVFGGEGVEYLLFAKVTIVDHSACNKNYTGDSRRQEDAITKYMICATALGKDSCQGDSGGPLAINNTLIGIVSFGNRCAEPGYPGVYTDVHRFTKWIEYHSLAPFSSIHNMQIYAMIIAVTIYSILFR